MTLIALGSLAFMPFTEQYARETAPREVWDTPGAKTDERRPHHDVGPRVPRERDPRCDRSGGSTPRRRAWLNWIIPIVLVVGAFKYTAWYAQQAREQVDARQHA